MTADERIFMGGERFRLLKVIVAFLVVLLQLHVAHLHADDLLERVRQSKSNDPEVREFLHSVLQHHNDFRWIADTVDRHRWTSQQQQEKNQRRREYRSAVVASTDAADFDGPVNDVYPYRDDLNVPQAQDTSFLYDEHDGAFVDERELAAFVGDAPPPHASTAEELLEEKLMLRNMLRKVAMRAHFSTSPRSDGRTSRKAGGCANALEDSDFDVPELWNGSRRTDEVNELLADFYNEQTHDVLGMQHDINAEERANTQRCGQKPKRSIIPHLLGGKQQPKRRKAIRVNVYDKSAIVKRIERNDSDNSLTIQIKKINQSPVTKSTAKSSTRRTAEKSQRSLVSDRPALSNVEPNSVQNKLEDLTEPTSAAEQRELGRLDNHFNTFPMFDVTTIGQLYVLPIKPKTKRSIAEPKAWTFRSRKLFATDEEEEYKDYADAKPARDIRTRLGMNHEEDYSEDKPKEKKISTNKHVTQKPTTITATSRQKRKHKQPFLINLSNTVQEKKALKNRMAQTTGNKVKKSSRQLEPLDDDADAPPPDKEGKGKRFKLDVKHSQTDRCCENSDEETKTTSEWKEASKVETGDNSNQQQAGELQIIEKTKAIVMHITSATTETTATPCDDDMDRRFDEQGDHTENIPTSGGGNDDDVVSEIIQMVQNYRNHVDNNNNNNGILSTLGGDEDIADLGQSAELHGHANHHAKKLHSGGGNCSIAGQAGHHGETATTEVVGVKEKREERVDRDEQDRFTPDSVETFKDNLEYSRNEKQKDNEEDEDEEREKRNVKVDGFYSDEEIDKLLSLVNRNHRQQQHRLRHQLQPFSHNRREVFFKRDEPSTPPAAASPTTVVASATTAIAATAAAPAASSTKEVAVLTTEPSELQTVAALKLLPKCNDIEAQKTLDGCGNHACHESSHSEDKEWREFKAKCEYGEPKHYADGPKLSKSERRKEEQLRQDNVLKLDRDRRISDRDEDNIRNMINGHISLDIIQKFLGRLKENQRLNDRFGHATAKKCIQEDVDKLAFFRDEQCKADVKHAQLMLHQVIVMLNKIVTEQVHRRTCLMPAPDLKAHLQRIVGVGPSARSAAVAEGYPLPAVKDGGHMRPAEEQAGFLFGEKATEKSRSSKNNVHELREVQKKIAMIKSLIRKYNGMSGLCQVKVEPVRIYLINQLRLLERITSEHAGEEDLDECDVKCMHQSKNAVAGEATTTATSAKMTGHRRNVKTEEEVSSDRRKRQIEQRLARLFGRNKKGVVMSSKETTMETPEKGAADDAEDDLSKAAFEAPLIYSLH